MIIGDHGAGKTHMALLAAIFDAHLGKRVLWQSAAGMEYNAHAAARATQLIEALDLKVTSVRTTNGDHRITFPNGGEIRFWRTSHKPSPEHFDVHIMDDSQYGVSAPAAGAERIIRILCPNP